MDWRGGCAGLEASGQEAGAELRSPWDGSSGNKVRGGFRCAGKPTGSRFAVQGSSLFARLDGGDDVVHGVAVVGGAGQVIADHDGEDDGAAGGAVEIAGEGARFAEGAGFGEDVVLERRITEAGGERAVFTADGQGGFP